MPDTIATTTLHFHEGGSDKVYVPAILATPNGFNVQAAYGRRGAALQHTVKAANVDEAKARKVYEKLVSEKVAKGYRPLDGDPTAVAVVSERDGRRANVPVQLLNAVTENEFRDLLASPNIVLQQKHDGERRIVVVRDNDVAGVNRLGCFVPLPPAIVNAAKRLDGNAILDGEIIGETLHVFDAQQLAGIDLTKHGFLERYKTLEHALGYTTTDPLFLVPCAFGDERETYFNTLRSNGAEGVVLRNAYAAYTHGRPNSGGGAMKYKFYATASAIVIGHNERHSVAMGLLDPDGNIHDVGNVTIAPSRLLPAVDTIIEVRYLYAFPLPGGRLYQPTFLSERDDITREECTTTQLQFKNGATATESVQ